jgi:acetyltransferase-like isoleucine patch superfamily enzyme
MHESNEYKIFYKFINNKKFSFFDYIYLVLQIPFDVIEFFLRNIPGGIGFKIRSIYYKLRLKKVGKNVLIDAGVFFSGHKNISLDDYCYIDKYCLLNAVSSIHIGRRSHVSSFCIIHAGLNSPIIIGNYVGIAANAKLHSSSESIAKNKRMSGPMVPLSQKNLKYGPITIHDEAFIGLNTVILPNLEIGYGAITLPNSVIRKSINELSIVDTQGKHIMKRDLNISEMKKIS